MPATVSIRPQCIFIATVLAACLAGCGRFVHRASPSAVPYTTNPPADIEFNEQARKLNSHGLRAFEAGKLPKAEELFTRALEVDVSFGPAHNNLGQIFLARHQLYLAAWEFEYASNLMPELVEPIINQGLAYETGERLQRAEEYYQRAYEHTPMHPVAIASLARVRIKLDRDPQEIAFLLDELILHDSRQEWVQWAKELKATRYRLDCEQCEIYESELPGLSGEDAFQMGEILSIEELGDYENLDSGQVVDGYEAFEDQSGSEYQAEL